MRVPLWDLRFTGHARCDAPLCRHQCRGWGAQPIEAVLSDPVGSSPGGGGYPFPGIDLGHARPPCSDERRFDLYTAGTREESIKSICMCVLQACCKIYCFLIVPMFLQGSPHVNHV